MKEKTDNSLQESKNVDHLPSINQSKHDQMDQIEDIWDVVHSINGEEQKEKVEANGTIS